MLRITRIQNSSSKITLRLEGRLTSTWVSVLENEYKTVAHTYSTVSLDVGKLSFIDQSGANILRRLRAKAVKLINCSPLILEMIGENESGESE